MSQYLGHVLEGGYKLSAIKLSDWCSIFYDGVSTGTGEQVSVRLCTNPHVQKYFFNQVELLSGRDFAAKPRYLANGIVSDCHFVVMERLPRNTLQYLVQNQTPVRISPLLIEIANAMEQFQAIANKQLPKLCHSSFLLEVEDTAMATPLKVWDLFLLTKEQSHELSRRADIRSSLIDHADYMSPQKCMGKTIDLSSENTWSLGCLMYELCCGRLPFTGNNTIHTVKNIVQAEPSRITSIPDELWSLIARCLEKEERNRPPMQEVKSVLNSFIDYVPPLPQASVESKGSPDLVSVENPTQRRKPFWKFW